MRKVRVPKGRTMRPTFFVFCEGESEEAYVKYLRSRFRLPIEVVTHVAGLSITQEHIARYKRDKIVLDSDRDYLMYDLDRDDVLPRLEKIEGATIIASNPCLEIWYLLHCEDRRSEISSAECLEKLLHHIPNYRKACLSRELIEVLEAEGNKAANRADRLHSRGNPSTDIPRLISDLEEVGKK